MSRENGPRHLSNVTSYGLGDRRWIHDRGRDLYFFLRHMQDRRQSLSSFLSSGYGDISSGVKWLVYQVDHLPPSNAEVKYASTFTLYAFMG
jgi:hypothetical protein